MEGALLAKPICEPDNQLVWQFHPLPGGSRQCSIQHLTVRDANAMAGD